MKRGALAFAVPAGALGIAVTAGSASGDPGPLAEPSWIWSATTRSPTTIPADSLSDREAELLSHCGVAEGGLRAVAQRLVERRLRDLPYLDLDGLGFAQRAAGEPHVWPRTWVVSGRALDHDATLRKLDDWRRSFRDIGERRCGVATGFGPDGTEAIAAIALDALADLAPIPIRARTGAWLSVDATLLVPTRGAHVVVLGPSGAPHVVPTSFLNGVARARFPLDRPGPFVVQVVADVSTGPRPVLEAEVFADTEPPVATPSLAAPGEDAGTGVKDPAEALTRMLLSARAAERQPRLTRDARLDTIAHAHARQMFVAHIVGHDIGDGDPTERLQNAGLSAQVAGENVAHAPSVLLAHRALYASPSHRANLLRQDFDRVGVAVIDDPDGSVWVAEVFTTGLR